MTLYRPRPNRLSLDLVVLAVLAIFVAGPADAALHNRLVKADPAIDGQVTVSPPAIRLWFAQKPERSLTRVQLLTADSTAVTTGAVEPTDEAKSVAVDVPTPLAPGRYTVQWKTAGPDGHVIRGDYHFTLKP